MNRMVFLLIAGFGTTLGCASGPRIIDPFREVPGFSISASRTLDLSFDAGPGFRIRHSTSSRGGKRIWLVAPSGKVVYPIGEGGLKVLDLNLMRGYAGKRFPFPGHVPLSLEPDYLTYLEQEAFKTALPDPADYMVIRLDELIPFPADLLDRALQLDARESTYRIATKWLYKERSNNSTLGITEQEREAFLIRMIHDYYAYSTLEVRKRAPQALILSQAHRIEDFEIVPIREFTSQFCDIIQVRYPKGERLNESAIKRLAERLRKPIWFRDVPVGVALDRISPLVASPWVIGWDWDRSRPWKPDETEFVAKLEQGFDRWLDHLYGSDIPSKN